MKGLQFIKIERWDSNGNACCSGSEGANLPGWITGIIETPAGKVRRIRAEWSLTDYWGQIRSRTSAFRMRYAVPPGLYGVGEPDKISDVFVSANYKLSFDILRRELRGLNAWILVLDTKGINVWCAAGKGSFGADELVRRIREARLEKLVSHNRLIVPQLGAVGVNARLVQKMTGFRIHFGPVYAKDIPAYLSAGYRKTEKMRTIKFSLSDRLILTPMEINPAMKKYPLYGLIILVLFGLSPSGIFFKDAFAGGLPFLILGLIAVFSGSLLTPALLPFIPFRSFAVKGWLVGMLTLFLSINLFAPLAQANAILLFFSYLFFPLASSYIALQFTGSTTFTGMSGVKKELKVAIPVYLSFGALSLVLLLAFKLIQWRIL